MYIGAILLCLFILPDNTLQERTYELKALGSPYYTVLCGGDKKEVEVLTERCWEKQ